MDTPYFFDFGDRCQAMCLTPGLKMSVYLK